MGIEDFNLYSDEFTDKILLITCSDLVREQLVNILRSRTYMVQAVDSLDEAAYSPNQEIWDMVVYQTDRGSDELKEVEREIRHHARLSRASLIVLHNVVERADGVSRAGNLRNSNNVASICLPIEPAQFLVKVATMLRLRKFQMDHARVECEIAVQNAQLRDLTTRFQHELRQAQAIQQSILPKSLPKHPKCYFATSYDPLEAVGGDLFDIWKISDDYFGFFIGDVTGHGLPAAFIGAMTKMALSYAPKTSPDVMLSHMANGIADHMPEGNFVTVAAATYNACTRKLLLAKGGHPNPYIWRKKTKKVEELSSRGFPLGVVKETKYQLIESELEPGDKFLMITDGLTETFDMNGTMLGSAGIGDFFADCAPRSSIAKCLQEILARQKEFTGGRLFKDDNTLIGLEVLGD